MSDENVKFGRAAVERGFITELQFEQGLKALQVVTTMGLDTTLGDILVQRKLMTAGQMQALRKEIATGGTVDASLPPLETGGQPAASAGAHCPARSSPAGKKPPPAMALTLSTHGPARSSLAGNKFLPVMALTLAAAAVLLVGATVLLVRVGAHGAGAKAERAEKEEPLREEGRDGVADHGEPTVASRAGELESTVVETGSNREDDKRTIGVGDLDGGSEEGAPGNQSSQRNVVDALPEPDDLNERVAVLEQDANASRWRPVWDGVAEARSQGVSDPRLDALARRAAAGLAPAESMLGSLGIELVLVPGGSFRMGREDGDVAERPVHEVVLSSFYVGRLEVTAAQFQAFERKIESLADDSSEGLGPAVSVSWQRSADFCTYLGDIDPKKAVYRLPTEAEWEYVARGSEGRTFPWGEAPHDPTRANVKIGGQGPPGPVKVGSYPAGGTPLGVLDMAGNAAEWCADWIGPYSSRLERDPAGPATGTMRAVRGGSFAHDIAWARASARAARRPASPARVVGFRVVRELTDEEREFERLVAGE